jgi:3-oxoacyl-[acyl-carrier protein] reductase
MRLKNKICIITGSAQGLGAAIARAYSKEGALVVISDVSDQLRKARKTAEEVDAEFVVELDVRDRSSIRSAFTMVKNKLGLIDVLVNNAGINRPADFDKQTEDEWQEVIDVDLSGVFRCCQEVLPHIRDGGRVVNIGSMSGDTGGPRTPSYAVAKFGLIALTHNLARFLGPRNICVNTLAPGMIANDFTERTMSAEVKRWNRERLLIPRFGTFADMVGAAVFLASDESSYLTAQTISPNGGIWPR